MSHTLDAIPRGADVCEILEAGLQAADPYGAVKRHLHVDGGTLIAGDRSYDLAQFHRILLVGAGKAGAPMADAVNDLVGGRVADGVVIVKEGYASHDTLPTGNLKIREAGHPLPDNRGVTATAEILDLVAHLRPDDLVIVVLSGGASALLTAPAPGISLTGMTQTTDLLLHSGASITEINTIRKHLDIVKGGGLARAAAPAQVLTLILSDVVGDPLGTIGSGPTVPEESTFVEALEILEQYKLEWSVPPAVRAHLQAGADRQVQKTVMENDPLRERVQNLLVGSNGLAAQGAAEKARDLGFTTRVVTTALEGEARLVGTLLGKALHDLASEKSPIPRPVCLIAGGETTVTVKGGGLGGRNQELALAAVPLLDGLKDALLISLATDGGDGPTDAAGALVNGETAGRARALHLSPAAFLERNDAYHFFDALDDLLKPGPTRTNVNDLVFLFVF